MPLPSPLAPGSSILRCGWSGRTGGARPGTPGPGPRPPRRRCAGRWAGGGSVRRRRGRRHCVRCVCERERAFGARALRLHEGRDRGPVRRRAPCAGACEEGAQGHARAGRAEEREKRSGGEGRPPPAPHSSLSPSIPTAPSTGPSRVHATQPTLNHPHPLYQHSERRADVCRAGLAPSLRGLSEGPNDEKKNGNGATHSRSPTAPSPTPGCPASSSPSSL